jgi:hypothetical protein
METLTCEQCTKKWKRQPARGRKPRLCPKCLASAQASVSMPPARSVKAEKQPAKVSSTAFQEYKFPAPTSWLCSSCGVSVETTISLQYEPTHQCQKRLKRVLPLELVRA